MTPSPSSPGVALRRRRPPPAALGEAGRAVADTLVQWAAGVPLAVWCGLGLAGVVALVVAGQGLTWPAMASPGIPHPWWFALPRAWWASSGGRHLLRGVFYAGMAVLTVAWLGLGARFRAGRPPGVGALWAIAAIWALPLVVAPVLLSTDLYTYLGQGAVVRAGFDPYVLGPGVVVTSPALRSSIPLVWQLTPAPYGPVYLALVSLLATPASTNLVLAVIGARAVDVAGLVLVAWALPRLARRHGADPGRATWLGLASPLVLLGFVLSGHNGALMLGLLAAGLLAAEEGLAVPALVLCTVATLVKAPAAAGALVVGLTWARQAPGWRPRVARLALAGAVVAATAAALSLLAGVGWGWLNPATLTTPGAVTTWFTPATAARWAATALGASPLVAGALGPVAVVLAGCWALGLVWRAPRLGRTRAVALALLGVALAGPVVWPWYLAWGVVLAAAVVPTQRSWALAAVAALAFFWLGPDGNLALPGRWYDFVPVLVALALVLGVAGRWAWRHLVRGLPPAGGPLLALETVPAGTEEAPGGVSRF